jgi:NAD(P)-dependent dehydrogenase (short-subunit alcohol dehydrogenase family)
MGSTHVVTGANRGIGLELARQLAQRGEHVIATARRPEAAPQLAELGVRVETLDVADRASVAAFAASLGSEPVDVLVNNAGIGVGGQAFGQLDYDDLERFFRVNSLGALRVAEALLPNLRAGGRRIVANMTSKMGSIADNTSGGAHGYRASKAALNALTKSLAVDLAGEGFVCVVLHPGWVQTDMGGGAAPLSVEDSAAGLIEVIDGLKAADNGSFLDYQGSVVPW